MSHYTDTFRKLSQEALRIDNYINVAERAYQDALDHGRATAQLESRWAVLVSLKAKRAIAQRNAALALAHKYTLLPGQNISLA